MEFLTSIQKRNFNEEDNKFINVKERKVLVIGGGDTAMDCVRTAVREGASSVKCLYRRDEKSMPGSKKEVLNAKEEGVEFVFNVVPKSILTNSGILATALELEKTKVSSSNGKQKLEIIEESNYLEEADIIIMALGFDQELPEFIKSSSLELDKWNGLKVNEKFQTSNPKIYSGGDSVRGADLAVRAAADGKNAALAIVEKFKN